MRNELPIHWQLPSEIPTLNKNEVHVWCASLDLNNSKLAELSLVLSEEEKRRAERFKFEIHRKRFIAAKAILKKILQRYLHLSPENMEFYYGPHGKPYLRADIFFNSSDSEDLALYAIAQQEVGIDVEFMGKNIEPEAIAERFFSTYEKQTLQKLAVDQKEQAFFRGWTRKEAFIKGIGEGLSFPLHQFDVNLKDENPPLLISVRGNEELARQWTLLSLIPANNYVAALAVKGKNYNIKYWQWKGND